MDISVADKGLLAFGRFRLDPQRRVLMHDGDTVKLTPKAFDTLLYLVGNAGRLVEKDELLSAVWGTRIVEEGNLSQTIFSIRKALHREAGADRWIVTAPGRGYRFTAEVRHDLGGPARLTPADLALRAPITRIRLAACKRPSFAPAACLGGARRDDLRGGRRFLARRSPAAAARPRMDHRSSHRRLIQLPFWLLRT